MRGTNTHNGGLETDFWRPGGTGLCWVCGKRTVFAWLDLHWQHPDCDMYPTANGDVKIVKGRRVT